ncbi:MAG: hypothetical protein IKG85_01265 [Clostridia bacterium]|nr:hypothetical protein [Clostridia bacterium]
MNEMSFTLSREALSDLIEEQVSKKLKKKAECHDCIYSFPMNWRIEHSGKNEYIIIDPDDKKGSELNGRAPGSFPDYFSKRVSQQKDRERFMADLLVYDWKSRGFVSASLYGKRYPIDKIFTNLLKEAIIEVIKSGRNGNNKRNDKSFEIGLSKEPYNKTINSLEDMKESIFSMTDGHIDIEKSKNEGCRITVLEGHELSAQAAMNLKTTDVLNEIWNQAAKFPLIISMLSRDKYDELVDLLRAITEIEYRPENNSFRIDVGSPSPIKRVMQRFFDPIREVTSKREYTVIDFIMAMRKYAEEARRNDDTHSFHDPSDENALIKQMIDDALDSGFLIRTDLEHQLKYHVKQLRLITAALSVAIGDNHAAANNNDRDRVGLCLSHLLKEDLEADRKRHVDRHYPGTMVYSIAYLNRVDESVRLKVLDALITIANDFSVGSRHRQQRALCILTYYLIEGEEISNTLRKRLFEAAYSRTLYIAQGQLWQHLRRHANIFEKIARDTFIRSTKVDIDKYACSDPYYHFLIGAVYEEEDSISAAHRFLIKCGKVQKETWHLSDSMEIDLQRTINLLEQGLHKLKDGDENDILFYVYGLQTIFYALSNLSVHKIFEDKCAEFSDKLTNSKTAALIGEALITCDYYNRLYNRKYDKGDIEGCYLMSGSIRFVCSNNYHKYIPKIPLGLMAQKYDAWLKNEHGRHRYLLMRLLAYTDYNFGDDLNEINEYEATDFLPYDHMGSFDDFFRDKAELH